MDEVDLMNGYVAASNWPAAESECRKGLEKEPGSHWWFIHLGLTLIEQGRYKEAKKALSQAEAARKHCPLVQ